MNDSIVEEIRRIKEEIAKQYNYDVRALASALQEEQRQSGREFVRREPKRVPTVQLELTRCRE
jgi:hypothetical protein